MAKRVGMSRNNTTFGKNIVHFMSRYHIHISSKYHFRHIHSSSQLQNNQTLLTVKSKCVEGYPMHTITVTTSHCPFLFIHPNISFQHRRCQANLAKYCKSKLKFMYQIYNHRHATDLNLCLFFVNY